MIISVGNIVITIIELVILFAILFWISWIISKKLKKNIVLIAICIFGVILLINTLMVVANIPFIIGIPQTTDMNGVNGKYISFGYAIKIEGHELIENSNYNVNFTNLFQ